MHVKHDDDDDENYEALPSVDQIQKLGEEIHWMSSSVLGLQLIQTLGLITKSIDGLVMDHY